MKNVLKYYYNISFDAIEEYDDYGILKKQNEVFIFKKYIQNEEETEYITTILSNNQIPAHIIIYNKDGLLVTMYNKEKYILLKLQSVSDNIDNNLFIIPVKTIETNIAELWSYKIDYYMQQIRELGLGKELLINSFNYYIGLAENAISIYNRSQKINEEVIYSISHRRIFYPNYSINYYDPTNMLIDIRVRDLAEFIKAKFFAKSMGISEAVELIYTYKLNNREFNTMFARLLYPTYYFDIFEEEVLDEKNNEKIVRILKKREKYEQFLKSIYQEFKMNYNIFEIEWIKK